MARNMMSSMLCETLAIALPYLINITWDKRKEAKERGTNVLKDTSTGLMMICDDTNHN